MRCNGSSAQSSLALAVSGPVTTGRGCARTPLQCISLDAKYNHDGNSPVCCRSRLLVWQAVHEAAVVCNFTALKGASKALLQIISRSRGHPR